MANPQREDGHIDIANEIAEALMRTNFSAYQIRVLWAIWRKTYGWHKREDHIPLSQLVTMTHIAQPHVSRTLKELKLRKILTQSGMKLSFNKDYTQWKTIPHRVYTPLGYTPLGYKHTPIGIKNIPRQGDSKETTKETTQKKKTYTVSFENFWKEYPNHQGSKAKAFKNWKKAKPDENLIKTIMASLKEHKEKSSDWAKGYIPHAATWLNGENWTAEFEEDRESTSEPVMIEGEDGKPVTYEEYLKGKGGNQ